MSYGSATSTGPKISSRAIVRLSSVALNRVGSTNQPSPSRSFPPVTSSAPSDLPDSM